MARLPRYVPEGSLVEISCRCIQGRFLLRPSKRLNELLIGVLGKALAGSGITLHLIVAAGNHYLCSAEHNQCYVERRVMWSWRVGSRSDGRQQG